ncbi:hypothetical protein [Micromonospora siamensis]|uniref:Uncharacterized protein n=1 Tax=Micromonospora siamensis TaxID=299152 RepID=A0A1C5IA07_9ACTN|nr:hypothetical protein [Micromonospora siamensis]SCG55074.1 hypothetical protein GA0074704_3122 [Micromonospora siamensis]
MSTSITAGDTLPLRLWATRVLLGVGVVLTLCAGNTWLFGAIGVALAIGAVAYLAQLKVVAAGPPDRAASVATVALFVGLALALAAGAGLLARWQFGYEYAARYGTRTTVTLSDRCTVHEKVYRGSIHASDHTECEGSTWTADGRRHTGDAVLRWDSFDGAKPPRQVEANAVGDEAYSVIPDRERSSAALWGGVPLWVLWAGLAGAGVGLVVLGARGRLGLRDLD